MGGCGKGGVMKPPASVGYARQTDVALNEILSAVASAEDRSKLELPPLYRSIDPEMLGRLIESPAVTEVSFPYCGYTVSIDGDSHVHLTPLQE